MHKNILLLLFLLFQNTNEVKVRWNEHKKVSMIDFRSKVYLGNSPGIANISVGMTYNVNVQGDSLILIDAYSFFVPDKSYITDFSTFGDSVNLETLNHEQRHFDLAELCVRKFCKSIPPQLSKHIYSEFLATLYNGYDDSLNLITSNYDFETDYGTDNSMQNLWDKKIDSLLNANNPNTSLVKVELR